MYIDTILKKKKDYTKYTASQNPIQELFTDYVDEPSANATKKFTHQIFSIYIEKFAEY